MRPRHITVPLAAAGALLLSACGGGASTSATGPASPASQGIAPGTEARTTPPAPASGSTPSAVPTIAGGTPITGTVLSLVVPPRWKQDPSTIPWQLSATSSDSSMDVVLDEHECDCTDTATPAWVDRNAKDYLDFDNARHPKRLPDVTIGGVAFYHLREEDPRFMMRDDLYRSVYAGRDVAFDFRTDLQWHRPAESRRIIDSVLATVRFQPQ